MKKEMNSKIDEAHTSNVLSFERRTFSKLKEYEGRLVPLRRAVEMAPRDPQAAYELAMLHMEYGRMQKGLDIIQRILKLHPNFTKAKERIEANP